MITVTNTSSSDIGLPGSTLKAGQSAAVSRSVTSNPIVAGWIRSGILQVGEPEYIEVQAIGDENPRMIAVNAAAAAEQDEKDRLIAALKAKGIERDRRYSTETLAALLEAAKEDQ